MVLGSHAAVDLANSIVTLCDNLDGIYTLGVQTVDNADGTTNLTVQDASPFIYRITDESTYNFDYDTLSPVDTMTDPDIVGLMPYISDGYYEVNFTSPTGGQTFSPIVYHGRTNQYAVVFYPGTTESTGHTGNTRDGELDFNAVTFSWAGAFGGAGITNQAFKAHTLIQGPIDGTVTFEIQHNNCVEIFINDVLEYNSTVCDQATTVTNTFTYTMSTTEYYDFTLMYLQESATATLVMNWDIGSGQELLDGTNIFMVYGLAESIAPTLTTCDGAGGSSGDSSGDSSGGATSTISVHIPQYVESISGVIIAFTDKYGF